MHHHYRMRPGEAAEVVVVDEEEEYIGNALQDLNVDRGSVTDDRLDNNSDTNSVSVFFFLLAACVLSSCLEN